MTMIDSYAGLAKQYTDLQAKYDALQKSHENLVEAIEYIIKDSRTKNTNMVIIGFLKLALAEAEKIRD